MMKDLFGRSDAKGTAPAGERRAMGWRRVNWVGIVGESGYQEAIRLVIDKQGREVLASLVPEPGNADDPNAVAVMIQGRTVGYLSPDLAMKYGALLGSRPTPMTCPAILNGGESDQPFLTVVLDFSPVYVAAREAAGD
jgi:hypothetical protein